MYNKNYQAQRPFLIVNVSYRPKLGTRTEKSGWMDREGMETFESIEITDRVATKHLKRSTVIIDVLEAKVVLNNLTNATRDEALQHFMTKYKTQVTEAIGVWMEQEAQKKALENKAPETQTV